MLVFNYPRYILSAILISCAVYVVLIWSTTLSLLFQIATDSATVPTTDISFMLFLLRSSLAENFSFITAAIACLIGINTTLLLFYIRQYKQASRGAIAGSVSGSLMALLGTGCATCGSLLMGPFLALFGASSLLSVLPFEGQEFKIVGIIILTGSIALISRRIRDGTICEI